MALTYRYRCTECGREEEYKQRITEDPLTECEHCGEHALKRIIQGSKFLLKGSDWYGTAHNNGKQKRFVKHGKKDK